MSPVSGPVAKEDEESGSSEEFNFVVSSLSQNDLMGVSLILASIKLQTVAIYVLQRGSFKA